MTRANPLRIGNRLPAPIAFSVGPWRYEAIIGNAPLHIAGERKDGTCSEGDRLIEVGPDCPPKARLHMLLHELAHAYVFAFGMPLNIEAYCDTFASMAAATLMDLEAAGALSTCEGFYEAEFLRARYAARKGAAHA